MLIDTATELYGILGKPVRHSLSPAMHNAAFAAMGLNKVYLAFEVTDIEAAVAGLRALGIKGASVTIPHKQAIMPHLDSIHPVAEKIGAVNTVVNDNGHLRGLNTDWLGANRALAEALELAGKEFLLIGAGGAARAIGFGLLAADASVVLASRNREQGLALAANLGCDWLPLDEIAKRSADGLINATSAGMAPREALTPVEAAALSNFPVVMDIVYSPLETRLLREARAAGCQVIDGLAMLLYQGVSQFEHWTGLKAPVELMRETLVARLAG